jgi:hypothetical protein
MDPALFETKAGVSQAIMKNPTKDMSGGWRTRVALVRAFSLSPISCSSTNPLTIRPQCGSLARGLSIDVESYLGYHLPLAGFHALGVHEHHGLLLDLRQDEARQRG